MTIPEFKKVGRLLIEAYKELDNEALKEGVDIFGEQYVILKDKVREKILAKFGFTIEEYRLAKEEASTGEDHLKQALENLSDPLKDIKIPTIDEIKQIADEIAQKYVVPPVITNQIVKEIVVKEPTIVRETKVEQITNHVPFDPAPIHDRVNALARRVDGIKIPEPVNIETIKESVKLDFGAMLKENINILDMPDWRKLAMGLQGQIDALSSKSVSSSTIPNIYDVSNYGASPSASEATNTTAIQAALDACGTAGGGQVIVSTPGTYSVTPILRIWDNTRFTIGAGVTLKRTNQAEIGMLFGTTYLSNSITYTWGGSTSGVTNVLTVSGGDCSFIKAGAVLAINSGTNFIVGTFIVVSSTATTITFNKNITTGAGSALAGAIGYAMLRDRKYDIDGSRAMNITIDGTGTIDMNNQDQGTLEFIYGIWIRKTGYFTMGKVNLVSCPINAVTFGDMNDTFVDGVTYNVRRAVFQCFGPMNRATFKNLSGTAEDNTVALIPGTGAPVYATDQFPNTGFGSFTDVNIFNINSVGSYNPIRILGPAPFYAKNIYIKGIHGTIWSSAGEVQGQSAVALFDDTAYLTGMLMENINIEDVDMTLVSSDSGGVGFEVHATATGIRSLYIKNIRVTGKWGGVDAALGTVGVPGKCVIEDVHVSPEVDIGANTLVALGASYGNPDIYLNRISSVSASAAHAISMGVAAGSPRFFLDNIYLSGQNIYMLALSGAVPTYNISNTTMTAVAKPFELTGGNPTLALSDIILDATTTAAVYLDTDANNGTATVQGNIMYLNSASQAITVQSNGTIKTSLGITNEVVSGSGTSFTLANTPINSSQVKLYANGQRLTIGAGNDYTISGAVITMTNSYSAGQVLADY